MKIEYSFFHQIFIYVAQSYILTLFALDNEENIIKGYSISANIPIENIRVAIAFIGLRTTVNLGRVEYKFDDKQPDKKSFETVKRKLGAVIAWKKQSRAIPAAVKSED